MNNDGPIQDAGDSQQTATTIQLPYDQAGSTGFDADENDYYRFTAAKSGELSLSLTGLADNLDLRLYDGAGPHLRSSNNTGNSDDAIVYQVVAGNSYLIRVDPKGEAQSNYQLSASISSGGQPDGISGDAGDIITSARQINVPYLDQGSVGFQGDDNDFYRFTSPTQGEATVTLSGLSGDANLILLDSTGEIISTSSNSNFTDEVINTNIAQGVNYYVQVTTANGEMSDYTLEVALAGAGTSDGDGSDVSNFFNSAPVIDLPFLSNGSVGYGIDSDDYYKIVTTSSGILGLSLTGLTDNLDLKLYNSTGAQIAASTGNGSASEFMSFNVDPVSSYTVRVDPFSDAESEYLLEIGLTLTETSMVEKIALLYEAALDRQPDIPGLNYFVDNRNAGQSLQDIANSFYAAEEFRDQFTSFDDIAYINQLYLNVLDRPADQPGFDYWLDQLENVGLSHANILVSFAESAENFTNAADWLDDLEYDPGSDLWLI